MKPPLLLRALPDRLCVAAWGRLYRGAHRHWPGLYAGAHLRHAPAITMELVPGDIISDCIAFTGLYELNLTRRVKALAKRGGRLIDVGANLGYFALLWTAQRPDNTCLAFEASPRNIPLLRRNVARNGLENRIEVVPLAAGKTPGKLRFDSGPVEQTGWGGFATEERTGLIDVDVVRVDQYVQSAAPIALLKVDIEGADAWALMGCEELLKRRTVQELWYEENKPRMRELGIQISTAEEYLRSVGYTPTAHGDPSAEMVEWSAVPRNLQSVSS